MSEQSYSAASLVLAGAAGVAAGAALGALVARREVRSRARRAKHRLLELLGWESATRNGAASPASSIGSAAVDGEGRATDTMRMVLVVRENAQLPPAELAQQAAAVVLGQFKKLYKRRDPALKAWEAGGGRMSVVSAPDQDAMMRAQAAARAGLVPTHTFAGARGGGGKARSVMAVGPAPREALAPAMEGLHEL